MNTLNNLNAYESMNIYQQPKSTVLPLKMDDIITIPEGPSIPGRPDYDPKNVYEITNGNVTVAEDGTLALTPQGQVNLANAKEDEATIQEEQLQAQKDETRDNFVDYVGYQSKKTQAEIYLSTAIDSEVDLGGIDTKTMIESLRETQTQNNTVQAYAQYQENQTGANLII